MLNKLTAAKIPQKKLAQVVESLRERILQHSNPLEVYLFGSVASDTAVEGSDIDIAIIYHNLSEVKAAKKAILGQPPLSDIPVDYLFFDSDTFNKKKEIGGVCFVIATEGKVLYSRLSKRG